MALETLSEEAEPLGLRVSWIKTKIQDFGGTLDDAIKSYRVAGEEVDIVEKFTYLGSVVHSSTTCAVRSRGRSSTWPRIWSYELAGGDYLVLTVSE